MNDDAKLRQFETSLLYSLDERLLELRADIPSQILALVDSVVDKRGLPDLAYAEEFREVFDYKGLENYLADSLVGQMERIKSHLLASTSLVKALTLQKIIEDCPAGSARRRLVLFEVDRVMNEINRELFKNIGAKETKIDGGKAKKARFNVVIRAMRDSLERLGVHVVPERMTSQFCAKTRWSVIADMRSKGWEVTNLDDREEGYYRFFDRQNTGTEVELSLADQSLKLHIRTALGDNL